MADKKKSAKRTRKASLKKGFPGDPATAALSEIASRAEGGKVAVMEKGGQPKVMDINELVKAMPKKGAMIEIEKAAADILSGSLIEVKSVDMKLGNLVAQFESAKDELNKLITQFENTKIELLEQREKRVSELQNIIRSTTRSHNVPPNWVADLNRMVFVPNLPDQSNPPGKQDPST
jgi:hypothetical protein